MLSEISLISVKEANNPFVYDFTKAPYALINTHLDLIHWAAFMHLGMNVLLFYDEINSLIAEYGTVKRRRM